MSTRKNITRRKKKGFKITEQIVEKLITISYAIGIQFVFQIYQLNR